MFRAVMRSSFATRVARVAAAATLGLAIHAVAVPATAQTAPTTLSFASWQLNEPGNAEWWKAVIAAFEAENKGIKIDPIYVPYASFSTQMTIRFASGRPPAVPQLSEQLFGTYAAQGWLRDIDDRIKGTDFQTDWVSAQKSLTWDGSSRGVILSNSAIMLFYNEKLLADAGVAPPKNWEEYKAAVAKVTKPDAGIFGLSAVTMEHPTVIEDIHRYARWAGTSVVKDGKYNLTSKEFLAAFDAYRTTVGKNAPLGSSSAVGRQLFVDGKTAFLIDGPWVWSWLEKASPAVRPNLKMVRAPFEPQLAPAGSRSTCPTAWTRQRKTLPGHS